MSFAFDRLRGLVVVRAEVYGPIASSVLRLALDTGATRTLIDSGVLTSLGYNVTSVTERVQVTTGSGVEAAARMQLSKLVVLGQERLAFAVLSHNLPPTLSVVGVLGLDFLRDQKLTIDFRAGRVTLE